MLELLLSPDHLPLQVASRVLPAPGVWAPVGGLALEGVGAIVTAPLGWEWDGGAQPWEARPGAFLWKPPRRPLERYLRRLARVRTELPVIFTISPDSPGRIEKAMAAVEERRVTGFLLWEATPQAIEAARRGAPALPLIAELPCTTSTDVAISLAEAGADALWLGPPVAGADGARLWGPSLLPLILAAMQRLASVPLRAPIIAGAGAASPADALRLRAAGAVAIAVGPEWWVQPSLIETISAALAE